MRVLVTGVTGFIGSSLARRLVGEGHEVFGLCRFTSDNFPRRVPAGVKAVVGDLTDYHSVVKVVRLVSPEVVIHLAALTPVSLSFRMPRAYANVNYLGTVNLVEACGRFAEGLKLFIYASTSEVYGNHNLLGDECLDEAMECRPNSPYAVSKYAAELYVRHYATEVFSLPALVLRPFNTYGRALVNQRHYVVEKIITSMLEGRKTINLGDPTVERDFLYREDHVDAYIHAIKAVEKGELTPEGQVINVATEKSVRIDELTQLIAELTGWKGSIIYHQHQRPTDIQVLRGCNKRAKYLIGWEPKHTLKQGLQKAIDEWRKTLTKN